MKITKHRSKVLKDRQTIITLGYAYKTAVIATANLAGNESIKEFSSYEAAKEEFNKTEYLYTINEPIGALNPKYDEEP